MKNTEFSSRFLKARKNAGLTQLGISSQLGIPQRTIENWESGASEPPPYTQDLLIDKVNDIKYGVSKVYKLTMEMFNNHQYALIDMRYHMRNEDLSRSDLEFDKIIPLASDINITTDFKQLPAELKDVYDEEEWSIVKSAIIANSGDEDEPGPIDVHAAYAADEDAWYYIFIVEDWM